MTKNDSMAQPVISARLVERGRKLFESPAEFIHFAKDPECDELTNDFENFPHAYVIACVMDRQIKAEKAWSIPNLLRKRVGDFEFSTLRQLSQEDLLFHFSNPTPLHRFNSDMARHCYKAIQKIEEQYQGDASGIWSDNPASAELIFRFLQFSGVGQKIASMAANILAREVKIPLRDHYSIDVSVDVHIKRVFQRLKLVETDDPAGIIFKARVLSPEFPGLVDQPCFEIGRSWCHARSPDCGHCYMSDICPSNVLHK